MEQLTGKLNGKRVLVVGASSGIGQGIAQTVSAAGGRVVLAARRLDRLEQAADDCMGPAVCLRCDVTEPGAPSALVAQAVGELGGLDVGVDASRTTAYPAAADAPGAQGRVARTSGPNPNRPAA